MLIALLFITFLFLLLDLVLYVFFVGWMGIFLVVPIALVGYLIKKALESDVISESDITGWDVGRGLDIENPDSNRRINVVLDLASIILGNLLLGGPGSGKSKTITALIQFLEDILPDSGWSLKDGKGDFDLYKSLVEAGCIPDYFFSSELKYSDTINVMDAPTEAVIDYLSRVLIKSDNPYYGPAQQSALRKVIPLLKAFDEPCNLMDLWALLTIRDAADHLILLAEERGVDRDVISAAKQYFEQDEAERLKTIDGMLNVLYPFTSGILKDRVNAYEPTLNIPEAVNKGEKMYFHFPLSQSALEVATMVTEIFGVIAKDRQLDVSEDRPVYPMFFDDWGKFIYDQFGPISARCRSAKMPISFSFQSTAQTDAVQLGNIFTKEITDNIGTFISLRVNGMDTAKWAAGQFGEYESIQVGKSEQTNNRAAQTNFVELPRVRPDALRNMNAGEACVNVFATAEGGKMQNKRYKVQFPLPEPRAPKPVDWPVIEITKHNDDCDGLHLWRDFMDAEKVKERRKEKIIKAISEEASVDSDENIFDQEDDYL